MDISDTIEPRSDQQNFDDYISGPRTVTVVEARVVGGDQPVVLELQEYPGRPYKPSKSMRRVLVKAWGAQSGAYAGRRMTLYGDPTVKWAGKEVGGIKISHLSHIGEPIEVPLTVSKGKRELHRVDVLSEAPPQQQQAPDIDALIAQAGGDPVKIQKLWDWAKQQGAPQHVLDEIAASEQPLESSE